MFNRGYDLVREQVKKGGKYLRSCQNCLYYSKEQGDAEEVCQNTDVLQYDIILTENSISCLKWKPYKFKEKTLCSKKVVESLLKIKKKSKVQEKRVAKELKGRVTPASGALDIAKGDVKNNFFLVECKTTKNNFYTLSLATWIKIKKEAIKDGIRIPLIFVDLEDGRTL